MVRADFAIRKVAIFIKDISIKTLYAFWFIIKRMEKSFISLAIITFNDESWIIASTSITSIGAWSTNVIHLRNSILTIFAGRIILTCWINKWYVGNIMARKTFESLFIHWAGLTKIRKILAELTYTIEFKHTSATLSLSSHSWSYWTFSIKCKPITR